jgi:SAM-dependent methyltransferase
MLADINSLPRTAASTAMRLVHVTCCVCDSDDATPLGVGEDFEYRTCEDSFLAVRCNCCGLIYLNPRPAVDEAARIYPSSYHAFEFTPSRYRAVYEIRRRLEAARLLRWCRGLPLDAHIVDVGCGDGFHLQILADYGPSGYVLEGIDTDPRAVAAARERGLTAHQGFIEQLDIAALQFDLALLIQTIEHVENPQLLLTAIRRILRPGGKLVIVTDNSDSMDRKLFGGRYWGGYHFPRHWNLFNKTTMALLAVRSGFEIEKIGTQISPVNWVYSLRNALVDFAAPRWMRELFSLKSVASLAAFTFVNAFEQAMGNGALLCAILHRPEQPRQ